MQHRHPRPTLRLLLLASVGIAGMATAQNFVLDAEPPAPSNITTGPTWKESDVALPSWPQDQDLVELEVDGPDQAFRYFLDSRTLQVGADDVIRFTLVAEGRGGTRNLSVEGIRCTPKGAYKTFAYGASGRFEPAGETEWLSIVGDNSERWRHDLWRFHLCVPHGFEPRPKRDMLRSITGRIAPRQNMGFQAE
jgi:hypothetical protein